MKAFLIREHGGLDKLLYEEVPDPQPGPFEVVVKVRAAALNHLDIWTREGIPGRKIPLPHISGCEGAGEVHRIGSAVSHLKEGDQVMITPGWSCGRCEFCLDNQDSMCLSYEMIGVKRDGCFAEYVSAPADTLYPLPPNLSFEEAACVPLVFQTAWHMLVSQARLKHGEDVLIQAAGSGVGIAGIQIAKMLGARVIATASTKEKLQKAKELGADILINYREKDYSEEIRRITEKRGVDVIFEHTGADNWDKSLRSLSRNGRLVMCGATSGYMAQTDLRQIFSRQLNIQGSYMGSKKDMREVLRFIREEKFWPVVDSVFPLTELPKAEAKMESRDLFGKIAIRI